ncbi:adenylate/guanylate cyclase domain-containing protein [Mycolicibacterium smegmatis]|uniref:adenylate/guanylate cyclase domain-containing protein n=1 Tax=Mycolicibacterium smegmatis TaxID=1772 RepID=UPI001EFC26AF|nr:adenylate/guanylate cyclase domain-containing protein [Mycolicibacterium smegmatis]
MQTNYKEYNYISSARRIGEILDSSRGNYEEADTLPDRDKLTYENGYYANCSAVFVDIRDSSSLPDKYKRPKLARLYRAYISEVVAILNGSEKAREINIVGDGVWAVFNTPYKSDIDHVFEKIGQLRSLVKLLNYKLEKAGYNQGELRVGIGASYGRALMIKAGYSGSGISDVVYMGDVVNHAAKLAAQGSKNWQPPIFLSNGIAENLKEEYYTQFVSKNWQHDCYTSGIVNQAMDEWYDNNCT